MKQFKPMLEYFLIAGDGIFRRQVLNDILIYFIKPVFLNRHMHLAMQYIFFLMQFIFPHDKTYERPKNLF